MVYTKSLLNKPLSHTVLPSMRDRAYWRLHMVLDLLQCNFPTKIVNQDRVKIDILKQFNQNSLITCLGLDYFL